jgi:hypothetical protein
MLIVGRLINGFGAGQLTAVFPVYASEVAPPKIRGMLGGLQMVSTRRLVGKTSPQPNSTSPPANDRSSHLRCDRLWVRIRSQLYYRHSMVRAESGLAALGLASGKADDDDSSPPRRGPLAVQAAPLILLIPVSFFLPETPRFLVSKQRHEAALNVLRRLHRSSGGETFVQTEFNEIVEQLEAEKRAFTPSWRQVFTKASWRKRIILAGALQVFAQLTGINCIQYYAGE